MTLFWLKKLVTQLALPPLGLLYLLMAGLLLRRRAPRLSALLVWGSTLWLLALSLPLTANRLHAWAGGDPALGDTEARAAQAIVILGGGLKRNAAEYGGDTVSNHTLVRLRYGARLARRYGLPVLLTGGTVYGGIPEAQAMREVLETDFGVRSRWTESASRDTEDNARYSAAILGPAGIKRVLLVTEGAHMQRSRRWFELNGLHVIAAPTGIAGEFEPDSLLQTLPSAAALAASGEALHELLGQTVQRLGAAAGH